MKNKTKTCILIATLVVLVSLVVFWGTTRRTNCGGNNAALAYTYQIVVEIKTGFCEHQTDDPVSFSSLVPRSSWRDVFRFGWGVRSYWVRKNISFSETGPVVICAQCFGNVPQPSIWNFYRKTPRFAAGFLTGRPRLIEKREYNSIDFNNYYYVTEEELLNNQTQNSGTNASDSE